MQTSTSNSTNSFPRGRQCPTKSQATFKDELLLEPAVRDPFSVDASARTNGTSSRVFSGFPVTVSEIAAKMTGTRGAVEGDDVSKPEVKRRWGGGGGAQASSYGRKLVTGGKIDWSHGMEN